MGTTLTALQAGGGVAFDTIIAIEGYPWLITTGSTSAAVTAWSGTDWSVALGRAMIKWGEGQEIRPWSKELSIPDMSFAVQPSEFDTFGTDVFSSARGTETRLVTALDMNDTAIVVKRADDFLASDVIYIGTETIAYSSRDTGTDTFTASARGKYTDLKAASGAAMSHAHTLPDFEDEVTLKPAVTSKIRTWVGRLVTVYIHRKLGSTLDTKAEAQRVFVGRITGVRDDELGLTWVDVEDIRGSIRDCVLMRDQWTAKMKDGVYIPEGTVIDFSEWLTATTLNSANALTAVVGASGANEIEAGINTIDEIMSAINRWLQAERVATRIDYRWTLSLVEVSAGTRTQMALFQSSSGDVKGYLWCEYAPLMQTLGYPETSVTFNNSGNTTTWYSPEEPYRRLLTWGQVTDNVFFDVTAERGTWFDNRSTLPAELGELDSTKSWGVVEIGSGSYRLVYKDGDSMYIGQAAGAPGEFLRSLAGVARGEDDVEFTARISSPECPIRQIAVCFGDFTTTILRFLHSTGTNAYNHATYDILPAQLGAALPYDLLTSLEADLDSLSTASYDLLCVIEKPTKLWEVIGVEFQLRAANLVMKNGLMRATVWGTPTSATALHTFTEDNKAEPSGTLSAHRTTTSDDDAYCVNIIKIEYNRTLKGSGDTFDSSVTVADTSAMEEMGQRPLTIKARNTFSGISSTIGAVDSLASYLAGWMPMFSRPLRVLRRSVDPTLYEGIAPGDHCTITDNFVRDPATGTRGITGKAGLIMAHRRDWGGMPITEDGRGSPSPMVGEVEILIYPRDRVATYCPCAQLVQGAGGYNGGTKTVTFEAHEHSESSQTVDVGNFAAGDKVKIIEIDPATAASPQSWDDIIVSVDTGTNSCVLTTGLTGFSTSLYYRMISDNYADAVATQKAKVYQADDADGLITDTAQAYEYGWHASQAVTWTSETATEQAAMYSTAAYGDGVPLDTGYERDLARLVNSIINCRSAPFMASMSTVVNTYSSTCVRAILKVIPVVIGPGDLMSGNRKLWVRPWYRSGAGASVTLRVSLCREKPIGSSRIMTSSTQPEYVLVGPYETSSWTTSSTTWAAGTAYGFSVKSLNSSEGRGYLVIEGTEDAETRGLAQCTVGMYGESS